MVPRFTVSRGQFITDFGFISDICILYGTNKNIVLFNIIWLLRCDMTVSTALADISIGVVVAFRLIHLYSVFMIL